ncbi:hypothetical protein Tco_1579754, partial [Tanacetum coccineum]
WPPTVFLGRLLPHARGLMFESLHRGFPSRWESVGFYLIDASIRGWQGLPSGRGPQDASPFLVLPPTSLSLDLLPCNLGTLLVQIQKVSKKNLDVFKALEKNLEVLKV